MRQTMFPFDKLESKLFIQLINWMVINHPIDQIINEKSVYQLKMWAK